MSEQRPTIWIHAFTDTDPTHGIRPEFETHARKYFDIITNADLERDISKAKKVKGALLIGARKTLFERHLQDFTNLKVLANHGAGTNHLDLDKFAELGIKVSNTPDVLNDAVAELTMALILGSARNIIPGDRYARETSAPLYDLNGMYGVEVKGSTVGIVGMGNIGMAVARLVRAFGGNIVYNNRNRRSSEDEQSVNATYYAELEKLLEVSDFVVLLCPLSATTRHLIGRQQLAAMKPTATLVNVARGPVVDTEALVDALKTKQIRGAALDVTDPEPLSVGHPLRSMGNVVLTPHWGSQTFTTRFAMFQTCIDNLRAALIDNKPMPNLVPVYP